MRNFFASMFGALLGILIAFFIVCITLIAIFHDKMKRLSQPYTETLSSPSVLVIRLNHPIGERTPPKPFELNFDEDDRALTEKSGLNDILLSIHHAAKDNAIKGIYLNLSDVSAGFATLEAIRNELLKFKASGKFILAFSPLYTHRSYYLASVADEIYLHPLGEILFHGLSAEVLFFKKALDKLGIRMQVFRHGKYKSFVEPFILDKMSPENRLQTRALITSVWDDVLSQIGQSRQLSESTLQLLADSLSLRTSGDAVKYKFVDSLFYTDQISNRLKMKLNISSGKSLPYIGIDDYRKTFEPPGYSSEKVNINGPSIIKEITANSSSKIAVIYGQGDIIEGEGDDESIGADRLARAIKYARLDDHVKAIVLRVNSPGGDGLASDIIWREVVLTRKSKPVIVSMSDLAASGGYFISCAADVIVAEPSTITGSIGVFGILPDAQELMSDKLGITVDTVNTNTHSAAGSVLYPLKPEENAWLQYMIENFYHVFLTRVAEGRNMTVAQVDSIAQGRVWSGAQAKKIGLVDTLGGMDLAVSIAADKAHLVNYSLEELPVQNNPLQKLLERFSSRTEEEILLKEDFPEVNKQLSEMSYYLKTQRIMAKLPYEIHIN